MSPDSPALRARSIRALLSPLLLTAAVLSLDTTPSHAVPVAPWRNPAMPAPASVPGVPRFINYATPPGVADAAGEPSIGSNWTTEQTFSNSLRAIPNGGQVNYFGGFMPYMLSATFNDCQSPAKVTWNQKPLLTANTPRVYGDPILFTDNVTGRTWVTQEEGLTPLGSTTDITDNDGNTFSPSQGSGAPSCVDHETMGAGPFHAPLTGGTALYPHAVYYASQCVADATIALSLDGGVTFGPSVPMFTIYDCAGLHGHIKVAPDGTVYVPDKACGGNIPLLNDGEAAVIVSEDNGLTWTIRTVPGATTTGDDDASVGVGSDGTIYLGYQSADGHPRIAVSHDKGVTWINIRDVGASVGVVNCAFPAVVAGDGDRAAFAFYGTTTAGAYNQPTFPGVWYLYIATTFDGGATWTTQNVTPGDPVQRGGICGSGDCRNQLDFFDATIDKQGRVLVGWDDGCINGCVSAPPNSFTAKAVITRQSGGKRMFAAYDPVEPRIAEAPALAGSSVNGTVQLSWGAPDDGGSSVTSYNVYRKVTAGGSYTLLATVLAPGYTDTVDPTVEVFYRVTAVSALGEGPYCLEYTPGTPPPSPCKLPGVIAVNDLNPNGTDNDAAQNTPPDPTVNVRHLAMTETYAGLGVNEVTFRMQMAPSIGPVPPESQWYMVWNRRTIAADGSDRRFVAMKTDPLGVMSFVYGDFGPPLPLDGSVPPPNANTPTPLGAADFGSFNPATGELVIRVANAKLDGSPLVAGNSLNALNVRTYLGRPDAGQKSQNNASDITVNGAYTLVGNASCFCEVDQAPVARLSASPTSGTVPLTVVFDAAASTDPDAGDAVGSYTFNFGDGSDPVTQASPSISHTYTAPSGASGYFATLTVKDQKCTLQSINIASLNIEANAAPTGVDTPKLPKAFRIAPMKNPSQGQVFLTLDMNAPGDVDIQVFTEDGRRVASLLNTAMAAGTHGLHWRGLGSNGKPVAAGVYLVRAKTGEQVHVSRIVLTR